ncbi:MAG: anhydro-N-acetylmuramic acid kinase, partial [Planctomycetota bacterium]|nr:anhydro-N-acetylmuramic acid kinase [Planctomycetota bacterium]
MHDPHQALRRPPRRVAGVLSGTSADGIDVAVAAPRYRTRGGATRLVGLEQLAFTTEPFPDGLGERVQAALQRGPGRLGDVALLHRDLGRAFGAAARRVAAQAGAGPLDLVASHGQTVFHHDGAGPAGRATLQLGDGDEVAEAAGCGAVTDLRTRDVAAGGEGAPLVALVDDVLFRDAPRPLAVLNLGGIANWTVLADGDEPARAFDAGPAGALLDGLARRLLSRPYDDGGRVALQGSLDAALLERLLDHPFLLAIPPKSTGRDTFDEAWIDGVLAAASHLADADILATAARFVARAAAD